MPFPNNPQEPITAHQLINQSSGKVEWYTPMDIIEAAKEVFGGEIDLDPATSEAANERIGARRGYLAPGYTEVPINPLTENIWEPRFYRQYRSQHGLTKDWEGKVWLNPPFGQRERACKLDKDGNFNCRKKACRKRDYHIVQDKPGMIDWVERMERAYLREEIEEGLMLTFASESTEWGCVLKQYPRWKPDIRVNYIDGRTGEIAKGVSKESMVTYFGPHIRIFANIFQALGGSIDIPWHRISREERDRI